MSTMAEPVETEVPEEEITEAPLADKAKVLREGATYLHIGPGAAECPDRGEFAGGQWVGDGRCENPDHWHGWLRVTNNFQKSEALEKAQAAQARRQKLLRTDGTDAYEILEAGIDMIRNAAKEGGDTILKDELVAQHRYVDSIEAYHEIHEKEEWDGIDADRERLTEIEADLEDNPEVEPDDETKLLRARVTAYREAIETLQKEMADKHRAELEGMSLDELVNRVREVRIEMQGTAEFVHVNGWWTWLLGVYDTTRNAKGRHRTRKYPTADDLRAEDPEIIDAIREAYEDLEEPVRVRAEGNS